MYIEFEVILTLASIIFLHGMLWCVMMWSFTNVVMWRHTDTVIW